MNRNGTIKKLCAAVTAAALVFQWSVPFVPMANASGFVTSIVTRTPSNSKTVPGSSLSFTFQSTNFTGGPVTNPFIAAYVAQNEYSYVTASWGFAQTPTNTFYPTSGFNPPASATGTISATVQNSYAFWISRALFTIPKSYPHPTFDVTAVWGVEWIGSSSYTATVKVDVFPHVSSATLSKPSVVNNGVDSASLTVTVTDKNGCTDLQGGSASLTLDLTAIWGPSAKPADSVSCSGDVATVSFDSITSTALAWGNAVIRIVDSSGHVAWTGDSDFWLSSPEISTVFIGVQQASAPVVTVNSPASSPYFVWPLDDVSVNWQSSQSGSYAIYAWPSAACWSGTAVISGTAEADSPLSSVVPAASFQNGSNTVAVCVTNAEPTLWQRTFSVIKDSLAPTVQIVWAPSVIGSNDAKITFSATESWTYSTVVNGVDIALWGSYDTANSEKEITVPNAAFTNNPGANTVKIRVSDQYSNVGEATVTVTKDYTPPSPVGAVSLEDCDYLWNSGTECAKLWNPRAGMTGRDFRVSWTNPPESESGTFLEYRVFVLPTSVTPNPSIHQILATVSSFSSTGTVVSNTFTADSSWTLFPASGTGEYRAWVYAYKKNGLYSTAVGSDPAIVTADAITYPTFVSASFTSGSWLAMTFSKPLSSNLSDYDSFKLASSGNCFVPDRTAWSWAVSVSWSTVVFAVENLSNPSKSCFDLSVSQGLVKDSEGLYNEDSVSSATVSDGQRPTISLSSPSSSAFIAGNGAFTLLYSLSEAMSPASLFAHFTDGSWSTVSVPLATAASAGNRSVALTWSSVGLLDGRTYSLVVSGNDLAGNPATSNAVSGIVYDVTAPSLPVLFSPVSDAYVNVANVPLTWVGSTDNSSPSSSVSYEIQVSQFEDFSVMSAFWSVSWWDVSYAMNPAAATNTGYYWRVRPTDAGGNVGSWTPSARFFFDNVAPVVSTLGSESYLWNVTRSFSGFAKAGDDVEIRAKISDNYLWTLFSTGITANLSAFWGGASVSPSSFASGNAAWAVTAACVDGTKTAQVSATDVAWNVGNGSLSAVCDNTAPSVSAATVLSPAPGAFLSGGASTSITWNPSFYAFEASPVSNPVTVEASSDGWSNWTSVASSVANVGSVAWTVPSVDVSNFLVRLSATDRLSNTASGTVSFVVDSTDPAVAADALTYPNGSEYLKGSTGTGIVITWDPAKISDANLADSPISIDYTNNGTDWISIASGIPNSWSRLWSVWAVDSNSVRVRISAIDKAGRVSYDQSDAVFSVDSTLPTVAADVPPTPPNGSFLSSSGFDLGVTWTDLNLAKVSYSLTDGSFYWNASSSSWIWGAQWNDVCVGSAACASAVSDASPTLSDGASYQFSYRSTDRAGNVKDSATFSYVADLVAPVVTSNVSSGSAYSWTVAISWSAIDARSGVSSVRVSVKRLSDGKYWWGASFDQTGETSLLVSTSNEYANWSYTGFSIPTGDAEGAQYLLSIKWIDKAYKVNNESVSEAVIVKDSVGPTIASDVWISPTAWEFWKGASAKTLSWNPAKITDAIAGVDQVSGIRIEYATGAGIWNPIATSYANSGSVDWTIPVMDGDATFRISAKDLLGNSSAWVVSPMVTIDTLQPQISTVETMDRAASGKIDGLLVTMSEPVRCSTLRASDFSVAWIGTPTQTSGCVGNSSTFVLEFAPSETTASAPWLTYAPTGILEDRAGNLLAPVSKPSVDKAVPRLLSASVLDADSDGKIDRIVATFSEAIANTTDVTAWTLNAILPGMSATPSSASVSSATVTLAIAEPTAFETSTGWLTVSFWGWSAWKDAAGNSSASKASQTLADAAAPKIVSAMTREVSGNYAVELWFSEPVAPNPFTWLGFSGTSTHTGSYASVNSRTYRFLTADSTAADTAKPYAYSYSWSSVADLSGNPLASFGVSSVSDGVSPKILSKTTRDSDSDGKIDAVYVTFSESLNGNVSGVTAAVSGYSVASYASSGSWLTVSLVERFLPDTDSAPGIQISNVSLADLAGNLFASEASSASATDGVWPIVTAARYDGSGKVTVTLSETYQGVPANDWFAFSGTSVSVTSATAVLSSEIELNVTGTVTYWTTSVSAVSGKVSDSVWNAQGAATYSKINASVVINEVMWSSSGSSLTQYVELRNLWPTAIDLSGFKIDFASSNGTSTITLPSSQSISGNGYYLIAASAVSTPGNLLADSVSPDYVGTLSLSPSQASNLVLKNSAWSVYDRAKANPFPAWSDALVASMERKDTPWDGLSVANWYSAQTAGTFFETAWPKGTPRSANVFDAAAPTFTSVVPTDGKLFMTGSWISVAYGFVDDVLIAPNPVRSFKVEKNDWSWNYADVTAASVASSWADAASASYALNALSRWAYRFSFSVSDAAGNQAQSVTVAYVDELTFDISTASANLGTLDHAAETASAPVVVTVSTVGAPFSLTFSGGTLSAGYDQIADWNGSAGYATECEAWWSASAAVCDSLKTSAASLRALENLATASPDSNGNLKTYRYEISFVAKPDELNAAWEYAGSHEVRLVASY